MRKPKDNSACKFADNLPFLTLTDEKPVWVNPGKYAVSVRPGRFTEPTVSETIKWVRRVKKMGIKTIICLLDKRHLKLYNFDLLATYVRCGLDVCHIPTEDRQNPLLNDEALSDVELAYHKSKKPVLIHCSSGFRARYAAMDLHHRVMVRFAGEGESFLAKC